MITGGATTAPVAGVAAAVKPSEDNRFDMQEASIEWKDHENSFVVGSVIDLAWLKNISLEEEPFFPGKVYVRKEMCDVFGELTKKNRKPFQILIGSPGVGKSVLLFLVALRRVLKEGTPTIFARKTKYVGELVSVFYMRKVDDTHIQVFYDRQVENSVTVNDATNYVLSKFENVHTKPSVHILNSRCLLYIDGLHEGDPDLVHPHHYLSTSGGYDSPQGESAKGTSLVVLGGWSKDSLSAAFAALEVDFSGMNETDRVVENQDGTMETPDDEENDGGGAKVDDNEIGELGDEQHGVDAFGAEGEDDQEDNDTMLDEIFYHTGGRIREVFEYAKDPHTWKKEKKAMVGRIKKQDAMLSVIETKGSGGEDSPDRVRTMFRRGDPGFFGDCLQVVDSQFFAHLLQDRCGLEQYYNAYIHAKKTGLASAAGCHFEELVHQLFHKCPQPIEECVQSVGSGAEGLAQLTKYRVYWAPSIPNFANIDAALLLESGAEEEGSEEDRGGQRATVWCFQYTVAKDHKFNSRTFRTKFLRTVLQTFSLQVENVTVKILFIVPHDVIAQFAIPQELVENEWESGVQFVDVSSVDSLESIFGRLEFIDTRWNQ